MNNIIEYDVLPEAKLLQAKLHLLASVEEIAAVLTYERMTPAERLRYVLGCSPSDMQIVTFTTSGFEVH